MKEIQLKGCRITVGADVADLTKYLKPGRTMVVTDSNVKELLQRFCGEKVLNEEIFVIPAGEKSKTRATVEKIQDRLLELEFDRSSLLIGVGGGVVTDIAGYAASTYMRGMDFGFVATTLLAQVDAAIGGKNGFNVRQYKNAIGTIQQPGFVICDVSMLKTLPDNEMRNGYAEIIKHAAIASADAFAYLEKNITLRSDDETMEQIVLQAVSVKSDIVERDETEEEERMKLNFGHTLGHAIETTTGIPHGEAVAIGMVAESAIAVKRGLMKPEEKERIEKLLDKIGLPTKATADRDKLIDVIRRDKKRHGDVIRMPVLEGIGNCNVVDVKLEELEAAINDMYPVVCTSITEKGYEACMQALENVKFGEIRLDKAKLEPEGIRKIFSSGKKLVATYHAGEESEQARAAALKLAVESGAAYVDIPIESSNGFKQEIIEVARANNCTVIISYHNFKKTPDTGELASIIDSAFKDGADIAKVACMVNSPEDNERLLSLVDGKRRLIVIGMGELGKRTRAEAVIKGAEFTFASLGKGKEAAPGQIDAETLERMIAEARHG